MARMAVSESKVGKAMARAATSEAKAKTGGKDSSFLRRPNRATMAATD